MSNTQKALNEATTKATNNFNEVAEAIKNMSIEFKKMIDELMVYLARLSGEDMSLLFYSALANGDYEMAERYAKARRQKIDSNPDEYGQYDWNTDYNALNKSMKLLEEYARTKTEHQTVVIPGYIGCGIAGGDWNIVYNDIIKPIFEKSSVNLIIVYFE